MVKVVLAHCDTHRQLKNELIWQPRPAALGVSWQLRTRLLKNTQDRQDKTPKRSQQEERLIMKYLPRFSHHKKNPRWQKNYKKTSIHLSIGKQMADELHHW